MQLYRVSFTGNRAVYANPVNTLSIQNAATSVAIVDGRHMVNWLTIFADDERQSMQLADNFVKQFMESLNKSSYSDITQ